MKQKMKTYFKDVAIRTSQLSTCASKQVGAVLVKDNRILGIGYNGTASGCEHCNERWASDNMTNEICRNEHHKWSKVNELHAEQNLLAYCAKEGISTKDTILFVTLSPCIDCAKLIYASGIKEIYYIVPYDKDTTGLEFLQDRKLIVERC